MTAGNQRSLLAGWISLISNLFLTVGKIFVGLFFNSQVLLADGVHNAGDVIASGAALGSMKISQQPADEDHPYGHGKAEVLGSGIVAIILFLAALYIAYHSVLALFEESHPASTVALIAAGISLVWKWWLYVYTIRIGKEINSKGLLATAYDHLADVYCSIAAVIGIGLSLAGEYWGIIYLSFGDSVAGIIVAFFVLKLAVTMAKEAADILMEKNVDQNKLDAYIELIESVDNVKRIDRVRAREHGHYILVDVRVSVPAELTVQEGHDISRNIKQAIMTRHKDVDEVLIHLNPYYQVG
ncbi:cation diffusion facilitator family transporter [Paenibacillus aceris]|uniref:Cation diffusion facilitator family transporter n=1 Tax=Paenibacillus aceris TaxID=869555 RepID=A0ABS4HWQ9_9BACL|nr:cation diffusion facilitator family transporter [Paenibacillus aceris]MBP1962930.1 cation diffusion facilitator family transporter [Paenibacillus aceris]NHW38356.1 cation transporter [Paenibacillus aceris]